MNLRKNLDTTQKINEVVQEYRIIAQSNKILPKSTSFDGTIREWTDKCDMIRISYLYAKNYWEDLSDLMELLYDIKKSGVLLESKREKFLEQITTNGDAFNRFYNSQTDLFKKACAFIVGRFSNQEIQEIFRLLPKNLFTAEKSDYQSTVQSTVDKYISEQSAAKLKEMWRNKTQTDSPRQWSKKYLMPILCMISSEDVPAARAAFGALNRKNPDANSIEKATEFLERADFFERLSSQEERDKAFRENIVKSYSVMLEDLDEVRNDLKRRIPVDPYDWFGLPDVDAKLAAMAEYNYNKTGCGKALEKIEDMDAAEAKQYGTPSECVGN